MKSLSIPVVIATSLLTLLVSTAQAQVIVDNFASANGFSTGITSPSTTGNYLAQAFTTDNASYNFVDVTIQVNAASIAPFELAIYDTLAQFPGNNLSGFVSATPAGTGKQTLQFNHIAASLTGVSQYYVVVRATTVANSNFFWFHSSNLNNLGDGLIGTGTNTQLFSPNSGSVWNNESHQPDFVGSESYILRVVGSGASVAAPEPASLALILPGIVGWVVRRRRTL